MWAVGSITGPQGAAENHIGYDICSVRPSPKWFLAQTTAWTQLSMTQKSYAENQLHWLRYLLYETLTEVVPGPNQTLDPPFSDAEIFPWVKKEHVNCWYYHWTPGFSTDINWSQYLLYVTLTKVVPGPN